MSTKRTENDSHARQRRRRAAFLRKRLTPRVGDVFRDLMTDRKEVGAYVESQCLKVAELTASAEALRTKLDTMLAAAKANGDDAEAEVRSLAAIINSLTRLEGTVRRAAADLGKIVPKDDYDWGKVQDEADRLEQERKKAEAEGGGE